MKSLFASLLKLLVGAAGGRPEVVLPLYQGLEKAAEGRNALLRSQSRRRSHVSPYALRMIMLILTALGSVLLAVFMLVGSSEFQPHPGVLVLVAAHWLLVLSMVINLAGPSLLVDDDFQVLGWWPLTRRELLLARLGTVLRPALEISLALGVVPLLVLAITGRPPVLAALGLLLGLLVQTVGLVFGTAAGLALVVRLWGRRRAQRLAMLAADGNSFMGLWLVMLFAPRLVPRLSQHLDLLLALPPFWFAGSGDLGAGPLVWAQLAAGTLLSALMVWLGLRVLAPAGHGQVAEPLETRPGRWHLSSVISWLLKPMMPGREGWAVRRMLEHHLREDWRFIGGMAGMPVVIIALYFGYRGNSAADLKPGELAHTAMMAVGNPHLLMLMASSIIFVSSFSSTPRALWLVALADLDTGRLLEAQRGMIRGLAFVPILAVYGSKAWSLGASWQVVLLDVLILGLQAEITVAILQPILMIMPFSLAYTNDQTVRRIGVGLLAMAVGLVFVVCNALYAKFPDFRVGLWAGLPLCYVLVRFWQRRRVAGRRLRMDVVVDG